MRGPILACLLVLAGCIQVDPFLKATPPYDLAPDPADFVTGIDHPHLPLPQGTRLTYLAGGDSMADLEAGDFEERIEIQVNGTRMVHGVEATIVRDIVYLPDGTRDEVTDDWFAQDKQGNIWYLGEATCTYKDDVCVSEAGAWEWGVDGALPGIILWADPQPSAPYYQEYFEGEARDRARVVDRGRVVTTPFGSFTDTVTTEEWAPLDKRPVVETVHYVQGIGVVLKGEKDGDRIEDPETLVFYDIPGYGSSA